MLERHVTVGIPEGLHARPAALFVKLAGSLPATVTIRKDGGDPVASNSILSVMTLGASLGDDVVLATDTDDDDARASIETLARYIAADA